jgi:hypothetical protein
MYINNPPRKPIDLGRWAFSSRVHCLLAADLLPIYDIRLLDQGMRTSAFLATILTSLIVPALHAKNLPFRPHVHINVQVCKSSMTHKSFKRIGSTVLVHLRDYPKSLQPCMELEKNMTSS